jgi:hypothetical protein
MKAWQRRVFFSSIVIGGQALLLLLAVLIGVMDAPKPKPSKIKINPPATSSEQAQAQKRLTEQLAELNRLQNSMSDAATQPILESLHPDLNTSLPNPIQAMSSMGAALANQLQSSLSDSSAMAMGNSASLPLPDPVEFLGESLQARRIVLLLDISASVKGKMERGGLSITQLRKEVLSFIDKLGPDHLFGIIQFSRNWNVFREELVPATQSIKADARAWMQSDFRTNGTSGRNWSTGNPNGIEAVLSKAFAMHPQLDEIFLLSDGDFQRSLPNGGGQDVPWTDLRQLTQSLQEENIGSARLRLLCFYPPQDAIPQLRAWASENGNGQLQIRPVSSTPNP